MDPSIRVLCVDDDPSLVDLVTTYLRDDYEDIIPVSETDPGAALERVRSGDIDCVISDYQMPRMNGLELLDEVRAVEPDLPFILLTGQGSEAVASEAVSAGVTDYIRKATGTEQYDLLVNRVRNAVSRNRARLDYRTIFDGVTDAILVIDLATHGIVDVNSAFCDQWQYDETTARSLTLDDLTVTDDIADRFCGAEGESLDVECVRADGGRFWASVKVKRATIGGRERMLAVVRDVTERHEREAALSALLRAEENLLTAETRTEIGETAVDLATDAFGFDAAQMLTRDETGELASVAAVGSAPFDDEVFATARRQAAAKTLERGELDYGELPGEKRYPPGHSLDLELVVPIGEEGVLVGNSTDGTELGSYEYDLMLVLAANVAAALDRADREELLRERESELQEQRDELASLNHTNEVIRKTNQALVEVSSRDEIERVVCERLASAGKYRLAWIGEYDMTTRTVTPKVWAGIEDSTLRGRTIDLDDDQATAFATAVDDRAFAVAPKLPAEGGASGEHGAREDGDRPTAVLPLRYRGKLYDVLAVQSEESDAFRKTEREVLSELGETIGYAMHGVQQRQALLADRMTELEFELGDGESLLGRVSSALDRSVELDGMVAQSDGSLRLFLRVEGGPVEDELGEVGGYGGNWTVISETESETLYALTAREPTVADLLTDFGAAVRSVSAEDGIATFVVHLPSHVTTRDVVDRLERSYSDVDLLAQRDRSHRQQSTMEFRTSLRTDLTDRQHEVLKTAHHAGFFEWPRVTAGEELAETLGISQSTFHEHLRAGERKLFRSLFDEDRTVPA